MLTAHITKEGSADVIDPRARQLFSGHAPSAFIIVPRCQKACVNTDLKILLLISTEADWRGRLCTAAGFPGIICTKLTQLPSETFLNNKVF